MDGNQLEPNQEAKELISGMCVVLDNTDVSSSSSYHSPRYRYAQRLKIFLGSTYVITKSIAGAMTVAVVVINVHLYRADALFRYSVIVGDLHVIPSFQLSEH